ncbi:uncharacterized protein LOC129941828 [Eupeodes corollae]|uniref:uncharacterized protein LOC129941828 n=1 Tax=Eupeodes corollae TaxID=290404 RepID=UPI00248F47EE|nr:uncharacterized protein LOC129941828 [Eupeodes corollae]
MAYSKVNQIQHLLEKQGELYELIVDSLSKLKNSEKITSQRIESRIKALSKNWDEYKDNHNSLGTLKSSLKADQKTEYDEEPYFKEKAYMECEEKYLDSMEQMMILLEEIMPKPSIDGAALSDVSIVRSPCSASTSHVRLPIMNLPMFSGEFLDWAPFKDAFTSQIGVHKSLTCVEKLQYLKTCLAGGKAASRLHTIPLTAANFKVAWNDLLEHYDNKRLLVDSALDLLFSAKSVTQESAEDLDGLLNTINQAVGSLEALGSEVHHWDEILVFLVSRKLDSASIKEWEKHLGSSSETSSWKEFKLFIQTRIRSLQAFERVNPKQQDTRKSTTSKNQFSKARSHHVAMRSSSQSCSLCNGNHFLSACTSYLSKTFEERHQFVTQKKLCYNCLGPHSINSCFSKKRCNMCSGRHHTSIHPGGNRSNHQSNTSSQNISAIETVSTTPFFTAASVNATYIYKSPTNGRLLATALVKVKSNSGERHMVRAFLDQGSEINLISEKLTQILGLSRAHTSFNISGIGAEASSSHKANGKVTLDIQSCVNEYTSVFEAYILPKLTNYLPSTMVAVNNWPHLKGLQLADPEYYQPGQIDLLLGVEVYSQIIQNGLRKGPMETPIAQLTSLGWILSGSTPLAVHTASLEAAAVAFHCHIDYDLNDLVKRFWIQEEVFSSPENQLTSEENHCEEIFRTTHTRNSEGRYIVRLPFKSQPTSFGDSRTPALNMIYRMQKRFTNNSSFYEDYSDFIYEYENLGHMRRASEPPKSANRVFYLPHHGVVREMSATTKLRVVFNGSFKPPQGYSLNEFLHEGPKLHVDLPDVLTRWRIHKFAFSSDVTKMFRQIQVHPDDWDFQRILWLEGSAVVEFLLTTVTYGTSPAPYLANRVLRQLASDEGHLYPEAKTVIEQNTYVDDVYSGASSITEASHESLLEDVPIQERASCSSSHSIKDGPVHRTLGLNWQPVHDRFIFISEEISEPTVYTKRNVLSRIAKLFDPLGWLSPVVVRGKIFMQELWGANLSWDEALPLNLELRWKAYIHELEDLHLISVPRWLGLTPSCLSVEIHGFADASHAALGSVIYLRVSRAIDDIQITILASKTKVAPIQKSSKSGIRSRTVRITTPRLELAAALLLTRHVQHMKKVLGIDISAIHLWTDSSTALFWIQGQPNKWKDFVRNRVSQIQDKLPEANWHHLPGEDNPADFASRGLSPRKLSEKSIWWFGPSWLKLSASNWPSLCLNLDENEDLEERQQLVAFTKAKTRDTTWDLLSKYSSLMRLLRITAWCRRFIYIRKNIQEKKKAKADLTYIPTIIKFSSWLKPEELDAAKTFWIGCVQLESFSSEISSLSRLQSIHQSSSIFRLTPFIDSHGILRIGGRLRNAQIDMDTKHPIILPRESKLTTLILNYTHKSTLHGGVQLMLATLRRNYWIIGGRHAVRSFVNRCVVCTRYRATTPTQLMGQLPINRTIPSRPFLHSGVDYAGPFTLKTWRGRGAKNYKGYLVVFVCFSTSAVHLELATDYSTEGFIAAFKRFTGRRGICSTLRSDCGTNFVGADAELRKLFNSASNNVKSLVDTLANDGTKWSFNPPSAPHFGGKWEAAVKSAKFHIKRVIGDTVLTYEEFSTFLTQVEDVLNSRPICPLSDDPNDLEALTPGHFIVGDALRTVPEPSLMQLPTSRLSRYQQLRQMLEKFWQRWSSEYLQRWQDIGKWHQKYKNIKEGALVLVVDERLPPSKWPLARVISTHPGADGLVRVVTVKTQSTTLKRPIVKLCLLPVINDDNEADISTLK